MVFTTPEASAYLRDNFKRNGAAFVEDVKNGLVEMPVGCTSRRSYNRFYKSSLFIDAIS
jgi:hypothetical protein